MAKNYPLLLFNSMGKQLEVFAARNKGQVKIFTCGPSIYQRPHIGNYRTFLYEDILVRYLEYCGYNVQRIINFTDVEDKSIEEALKQNRQLESVTGDVAKHFYKETQSLHIKLPPTIPASSTSVTEAAGIIKKLVESGHAYWYKGNVFFDPLKHKGFGRLFGLDMSRWPEKKVRFKRDTYNGLRWNLGDFILWHKETVGEAACWDTEIGKGRPSWNVQDPAMIIKHLGDQVDINCGGIDNIYRHHDYNIAIMESYTGKEYANYFLHGAHLIVNGNTMSKSRGNILYPEHVEAKGYSMAQLRYFLLTTHYRKRLNYTEKNFDKRCKELAELHNVASFLLSKPGGQQGADVDVSGVKEAWENNMNQDLSFGLAMIAVKKDLEKIRKEAGEAGLSGEKRTELRQYLEQIDSVACVIF